jgi:chromosome partitioning protein
MAHIISIVNQKGGTGKTTTAVNLGVALGKLGQRVLLVDFDAQASLTFYFGISRTLKGSMADVVFGDKKIADITILKEGIYIAPAAISLADAELSLATYSGRMQVLKDALATVQRQYDYILIDCGPALSLLTVNALAASSHVLIPTELEVLALQGLQLISNTIARMRKSVNADLQVLGVLLLMVDLKRTVTQEVYELLLQACPYPIFKAHVEVDDKAIEAPSFGQSILSYAPNASSATAYLDLALEVLGKLPPVS